MADFTVDENGVVYDNRGKPYVAGAHPKTATPPPDRTTFTGSWWVALLLLLWIGLIGTAIFANRPFPIFEACSGPDCLVVPIIFLLILTALCACFIFNPALAQEFRSFRYITSCLLFLFLADYGLAGTLDWWYEGRHYVVETISKSSRRILWITEPSNSTLISLMFLLSPLSLLIPDVMRFVRKRRP